jgi:malonate-semialdehyde dehydrogenase (acetylating)/methylmalonate-semialdehyde dehydrogenase
MNLVNGGKEAVNALLDHPGVKGISFVGASKTAAYVYARAAANGKRVQASAGRRTPSSSCPTPTWTPTSRRS